MQTADNLKICLYIQFILHLKYKVAFSCLKPFNSFIQCSTNRGQYLFICVLSLNIDPLLCNIYSVEIQWTNVMYGNPLQIRISLIKLHN